MDDNEFGLTVIVVLSIIVMVFALLLKIGKAPEGTETVNPQTTEGTFSLLEDKNTGILYIKNTTYYGYQVYTPYYGAHGNPCKLDDNKIVEVGYEGILQEVEDKTVTAELDGPIFAEVEIQE